MMPLGAPSITKYGSLVRPDAQIVALRAHCARTALKAPPLLSEHWGGGGGGDEPCNQSLNHDVALDVSLIY